MTFAELQKANEMIQSIPIEKRDKKTGTTTVTDYSPVNQRIKAFRSVYPEGSILTEMISLDNGVVIFKATVCTEEGVTLGVGHACEKEGSTFINATSFIENAETSAVGRALGNAGFGIDTSIASAEEVQNAMLNQNKSESKMNDSVKSSRTKTAAETKPAVEDELPWNENAMVPAGTVICSDCMKIINDTKNRNGELWTADSIASYTEKRFGRRLCVDCMKKISREATRS